MRGADAIAVGLRRNSSRDPAPEPAEEFRPIQNDLVAACYKALADVERRAKEKMANPGYWHNVGFVEGAAYDLCVLTNEIMPRFDDLGRQRQVGEIYMLRAKEVYRRYFDDYDEDGYGLSIFNIFIEIFHSADKTSVPFYDNLALSNTPWKERVDVRPDAPTVFDAPWDGVILDRMMLSVTSADARAVMERLMVWCRDLSNSIFSVLYGPMVDEYMREYETLLSKGSDVNFLAFLVFRRALFSITLLNLSGLALHPLRLEALRILQAVVNIHIILPSLSQIDPLAAMAARAEMLCHAAQIDAQFVKVTNDSSDLARAAMMAIHHGLYFSGIDLLDNPIIDIKKECCCLRKKLIYGLSIPHYIPDIVEELHDLVGRSALERTERLPIITPTGWMVLWRRLAELDCDFSNQAGGPPDREVRAGRLQRGLATMADVTKIAVEQIAGTGYLLREDFRLDESCIEGIIGVVSILLTEARENLIFLTRRPMKNILWRICALRDYIRTGSTDLTCTPSGLDGEEGACVTIVVYFRILDYFSAWKSRTYMLTMLSVDMRADMQMQEKIDVLKFIKEGGDPSEAFEYIKKQRLENAQNTNQENFFKYVQFDVSLDSGAACFRPIGASAEIDRMISDFRGWILGQEGAEERASLIPPKIIDVIIFQGSSNPVGESSDQKDKFWAKHKCNRVAKQLFAAIDMTKIFYIVPDGEMFRLPWDAIIQSFDDNKRGPYLYSSVAYSLRQCASWSRIVSPEGSTRGVVVDSPDYDLAGKHPCALDPLVHAADEAESVARYFEIERLTGRRAHKQALAALSNPLFLHIITHMGVRDERLIKPDEDALFVGVYSGTPTKKEAELQRMIALTGAGRSLVGSAEEYADFFGNGILNGDDFQRLNLHQTMLVVLSGCESIQVTIDHAGRLHSFGLDVFRAGAQAVIGSVWKSDDRATGIFMSRLYERLADGAVLGAAFHDARELARLQTERFDQWSPFVLLGNPNITLKEHHEAKNNLTTL
ncbi:CHAT domain-containing protein [Pararhodospirillum photometricum]|uniref:CHAT domain-containing protein n=1 Tax=Pararhodospirillum photometricum TaxID=1084 RepID=UPI0012FE95DE|nr:CHAT domain-containing protein [Pararhodospirillum photometricum]